MGRTWIRANLTALAAPVAIPLPIRETGYFPAETPTAIAYRVALVRGRTFEVEIHFESTEPTRLFVDLFEIREQELRRVSSLPADSSVLRHEVRRTGTYVLRIQPELLRSGRYTVVQRTVASLVFPVPTLSSRAIRSVFGAPREAGRRRHEGVDIFAPKGTPVIAVREGFAVQGTNRLGGNIVWLRDARSRRSYYYAHLDHWAFEGSRPVVPGDTLGFIGNTGNAITTPSHLHFGVYESGAVDPAPFLAPDDSVPPPVGFPADRLFDWIRVTAARSELRRGPARDAPAVASLVRGEVGIAMAATQGAVRVRFPDGTAGYVDRAATGSADPLGSTLLPAGSPLLEAPAAGAPAVLVLDRRASADVLGRFGDFELVQVPGARPAWRPVGTAGN
jgi:murein DD-endopeptidase MepM/ murein hydrolase activator NlpD